VFGNATVFLWQRPVGGVGYEIRACRPYRALPPEPMIAARPDARLEEYTPLRDERALFIVFSETELTDEGVLGFVNSFGLLGAPASRNARPEVWNDPATHERGDAPGEVLQHVRWMREAIRLWKLVQAGDQEGLADSFRWEGTDTVLYLRPEDSPPGIDVGWGERAVVLTSPGRRPELLASFTPGDLVGPARFRLHMSVNSGMAGRVGLKLLRQEDSQDVLDVLPDSLLSALWLQLALAIAGNKDYRRCYQCGRPFELAPDVNRTSRFTCSAACRNRAYRERQDRARQLHAEGKSFKQIARELESTVKVVKGWVTGRREK
jgi:hypothetical protein